MNIQRKNSAHHFRMQSEREQTLVQPLLCLILVYLVRFCLKRVRLMIHSSVDSTCDESMTGKEAGSKEAGGKGAAGEGMSGVVESEDIIEERVARENISIAGEAGKDLGTSDGRSVESEQVSPSSKQLQVVPETPTCITVTPPSSQNPLIAAGLVPSDLADIFCTSDRDENRPKRRRLTNARVLTENEYYDMLKEKEQKEKEEQGAKEKRKKEREQKKKENEEKKHQRKRG